VSHLLYARVAGRNIQGPRICECPAPRIQHCAAQRIVLSPSRVTIPQANAHVDRECAMRRVREMLMRGEVGLLPTVELGLAVEALNIVGACGGGLEYEACEREIMGSRS
jgi:hypothetical protein